MIMKKVIFGFVAVLALATSVSVLANVHNDGRSKCDQVFVTAHVSSEGTHCSGTVGCNCSGFSPITDGEVWQQAYCKHCSHHRRSHK